MEVKEAVRRAREYVSDVFEDQGITDVGLEEVEYKFGPPRWEVTIGSLALGTERVSVTVLGEGRPARSYKVLRVNDENGEVESLTDRVLTTAE